MSDSEQCRMGKGTLAGLVGGLAGAWAMNEFQALLSRAAEQHARHHPSPPAKKPHHADDATVKTAEMISRELFHHPLSRPEKKLAGPLVHYGYGALVGGLYGALAEAVPPITTGFGAAYGSAAFLLGDELAVPALGLAPSAAETPLSRHAEALAAHLVYATVLNAVRLALR